jgi:bifunctional non-homologous end joining protein LigD
MRRTEDGPAQPTLLPVTESGALVARPIRPKFGIMLWRTQAPKRRPPGFIEPCIPTSVSKPPVGAQWIHEIKHDGYRLIVRKQGDRVRLFTRRGYDWTDRYPRIATAAAKLSATSAVLDGEAVCCDDAGVADFEKLHSRAHDGEAILDLLSVLVHDNDEPAGPVPARQSRAVIEVARDHYRIGASGGIAGQVNALVVAQNLLAIGEVEIVARHGLHLACLTP